MNQEKKIIEYLRTNTEITTLAAFQTFKITRLAARIKDIKNRFGDDAILDRWMITPNATVKAYRLSPAFKAMLDVKKKEWPQKHPLCKGDGIDHCGYYTTIDCDNCKYGGGKKDPEAKCNQLPEFPSERVFAK